MITPNKVSINDVCLFNNFFCEALLDRHTLPDPRICITTKQTKVKFCSDFKLCSSFLCLYSLCLVCMWFWSRSNLIAYLRYEILQYTPTFNCNALQLRSSLRKEAMIFNTTYFVLGRVVEYGIVAGTNFPVIIDVRKFDLVNLEVYFIVPVLLGPVVVVLYWGSRNSKAFLLFRVTTIGWIIRILQRRSRDFIRFTRAALSKLKVSFVIDCPSLLHFLRSGMMLLIRNTVSIFFLWKCVEVQYSNTIHRSKTWLKHS